MIIIHTDGACKGNPGAGGWAYLQEENGRQMSIKSGGIEQTTNNAAELWAIYYAICNVPDNSNVLFVTDSRNVIGWLSKGWRRRQEHINTPCELIEHIKKDKGVKWAFKRVKGHNGYEKNEIVDRLASAEALAMKLSQK